jgi:hypothetical protein
MVRHDVALTGDHLAASLDDYMNCDVFILQDLWTWKKHPAAANTPASTKVIRYPSLSSFALWPFDGFHAGEDPVWRAEGPKGTFTFSDNLMARLRGSILDLNGRIDEFSERLRVYQTLDWPGLPDLHQFAGFDERRLLAMDSKFDSRLGRFIVEKYRSKRLFHCAIHPAGPLLIELAAELLEKIGLDSDHVRSLEYDPLRSIQVPIHPHVIDALGITFVDKSTRYQIAGDTFLSFDEYYELYIRTYF